MAESEAGSGHTLPGESSVSAGTRLVSWLLAFAVCSTLGGGCVWLIQRERRAAQEMVCENQLKLIWLALENYADSYHAYPPARTLDDCGNSIHSWRALLMPYLGHYSFDKQYRLSEPWDSATNRLWTTATISGFQCPSQRRGGTRSTSYVAIIGRQTMWTADRSVRRDEAINPDAIFIVEYPELDIPWGEPRDLTEEQFLAMLNSLWSKGSRGPHPSGLLYVTVSGHIRGLTPDIGPADVRRLLQARHRLEGAEAETP